MWSSSGKGRSSRLLLRLWPQRVTGGRRHLMDMSLLSPGHGPMVDGPGSALVAGQRRTDTRRRVVPGAGRGAVVPGGWRLLRLRLLLRSCKPLPCKYCENRATSCSQLTRLTVSVNKYLSEYLVSLLKIFGSHPMTICRRFQSLIFLTTILACNTPCNSGGDMGLALSTWRRLQLVSNCS